MAKKRKNFAGMLKIIPSTEQELAKENQTNVPDNYSVERWLPTENEAAGELTSTEQERLAACEIIIRENLQSFLSVGKALWEIRQGKLYRATHKTFEAYCDETFGLGRRNAYHLMEGVTIVEQLRIGAETDAANSTELPATNAHTRALANVETELRQEVWNTVVEEARETGNAITAKKIKETNERLSGKSKQKKPKASNKPKSPAETDDEFGEEQADITRQSMNNPAKPVFDSNDESVWKDVETVNALYQEDADFVGTLKMALMASGPADVQVTITGAFLIGYGLDEGWQQFRKLSVTIDENFTDTLSYREARELGIL